MKILLDGSPDFEVIPLHEVSHWALTACLLPYWLDDRLSCRALSSGLEERGESGNPTPGFAVSKLRASDYLRFQQATRILTSV
jgi:hypothetical protein